jgi:predicted DNA-binding transcriptional regulator AlpA
MVVEQRQEVEPICLDAAASARLIGVSRSTFLRMESTGLIGPKSLRLSRRRVWIKSELVSWIEDGRGCSRREWLDKKGAA